MAKKYKYTVFTLILAFAFSFGSMKGMDVLLKAKERQLLGENGEVPTAGFNLGWQEKDLLTMGQIEEVVKRLEISKELTAHNRENGQITIEQAIKAASDWMLGMKIGMSEYGLEGTYINLKEVKAVLGTLVQEEEGREQAEPEYSFWKVEFSNPSMEGFFYVNAVSGKVWYADMTIFDYLPEQMPYWKLKYFIELAGFEASYKGAVQNQQGTEALWEIEDIPLCAKTKFVRSMGLPPDSGMNEKGEPDIIEPALLEECVNIIFKLTTDKADSMADIK